MMMFVSIHLLFISRGRIWCLVPVGFTNRGNIISALGRKTTSESIGFQMARPNENRKTATTITLPAKAHQSITSCWNLNLTQRL